MANQKVRKYPWYCYDHTKQDLQRARQAGRRAAIRREKLFLDILLGKK